VYFFIQRGEEIRGLRKNNLRLCSISSVGEIKKTFRPSVLRLEELDYVGYATKAY
jgi:hypothetical protein